MKIAKFAICLCLFTLCVTNIHAKIREYTYYDNLGFAIDNSYALVTNTLYMQMYEEYNKNNPDKHTLLGSFTCSQNTDSNDVTQINIININITQNTSSKSESTIISEYKTGLTSANMLYQGLKWQRATGVKYSFNQNIGGVDVPTIAFYGYKEDIMYLIQVASLSNVERKFDDLLNSITLLVKDESTREQVEDTDFNNQIIGQSGVAKTEGLKSPLQFATDNDWAFDSRVQLEVGDIAPAVKDGEIEYIGDIAARIEAGENLDDIRAANQSWGERNKTVVVVVIISLIFFLGIIYFDKSKK